MVTAFAVVATSLAAVAGLLLARAAWGMPWRDRVLVTLVHPGSPSLEGVWWQCRGRWLELRDASMLESSPAVSTPLDGAVLVPREHVLFVQRVGRADVPRPVKGHRNAAA